MLMLKLFLVWDKRLIINALINSKLSNIFIYKVLTKNLFSSLNQSVGIKTLDKSIQAGIPASLEQTVQ